MLNQVFVVGGFQAWSVLELAIWRSHCWSEPERGQKHRGPYRDISIQNMVVHRLFLALVILSFEHWRAANVNLALKAFRFSKLLLS